MPRSRNSTSKYSYHNPRLILIYAFVISFIWHAVWAFVFQIGLEVDARASTRVTRSIFIGNFVKEQLLKGKMADDARVPVSDELEVDVKAGGVLPLTRTQEDVKSADYVYSEGINDIIESRLILSSPVYRKSKEESSTIKLKGPLSKRDIVYIPPKPQVPEWVEEEGQFTSEGKLLVNSEGKVVFVEKLSSSGQLEIDFLIKNYLKKIRFSQMPGENDYELQWGIAKITLQNIDD